MVIPQGITAKNKLYISPVPQTVAGCRLYGWLPMWLQTSGSGPVWFYEWYPNGRSASTTWDYHPTDGRRNGSMETHRAGTYSSTTQRMEQLYLRLRLRRRLRLLANPGLTPELYHKKSAVLFGHISVTLRSSWFKGYDVYLDGKYVGTEGSGSDLLDGIYNFRVPGNMWHTIVISKNGQSYDETGTFVSGAAYRFTL